MSDTNLITATPVHSSVNFCDNIRIQTRERASARALHTERAMSHGVIINFLPRLHAPASSAFLVPREQITMAENLATNVS